MKATKTGRTTIVLNWLCVFTRSSINKKGSTKHQQRGRRPKIILIKYFYLFNLQVYILYKKNHRICKNKYLCVIYVNHCASKDNKEYFKPLHNMKWEKKESQEYRRSIDFTVHPNKNVLNMKNEYFLII